MAEYGFNTLAVHAGAHPDPAGALAPALAQALQARPSLQVVAHVCGTEADPQVLFCSLHEEGNYPLEGGCEVDQGQGAGAGYTVNIPLPAGSGYAAYALAFEQVLLPVLQRFRPS